MNGEYRPDEEERSLHIGYGQHADPVTLRESGFLGNR